MLIINNFKQNNLLGKILLLIQCFHFFAFVSSAVLPSNTTDSSTATPSTISDGVKCRPNTESCPKDYSCIRFNNAAEDEFTCVATTRAYCQSDSYCQENLGPTYKYCYLPPWDESKDTVNRRQCFTVHSRGMSCSADIHCVETLSCVDNICTASTNSSSTFKFDGDSNTNSGGSSNTILGINKWIVITAIAIPCLIVVCCLWCWLIGSKSSKRLENRKKEKYETELKKLTLPTIANGQPPSTDKDKGKRERSATSGTITPVNNKSTTSSVVSDHSSLDIASAKIGKSLGKSNAAAANNHNNKKGYSSTSLANVSTIDNTSNAGSSTHTNTRTTTPTTANEKKSANTTTTPKKAVKRSTNTSNANSSAISGSSATNAASGNTPKKIHVRKKAAQTKAKPVKKQSNSQSDTNNSNSSSQRGLVNNAAALSPSGQSSQISGQSASYFSGVTPVAQPMDPNTALYYQQMYNAAAAASQNQYYAANYMQNPYYGQPSAYTAAAPGAYYTQDPSILYGTATGSTANPSATYPPQGYS